MLRVLFSNIKSDKLFKFPVTNKWLFSMVSNIYTWKHTNSVIYCHPPEGHLGKECRQAQWINAKGQKRYISYCSHCYNKIPDYSNLKSTFILAHSSTSNLIFGVRHGGGNWMQLVILSQREVNTENQFPSFLWFSLGPQTMGWSISQLIQYSTALTDMWRGWSSRWISTLSSW